MKKTLVIIHTVKETLNTLDSYILANSNLDIDIFNLYDDGFAKPVNGSDNQKIMNVRKERLKRLIDVAECQKPDLIFVACSTLSLEAELIRNDVSPRIITVDEAMINFVTDCENQIVLFATSPNPIYSVKTRLNRSAESKGKSLVIETALCEDALQYLLNNDIDSLKRTAADYIRNFKPKHNIVFAQLSSQLLKETFEEITGKKVYTAKDYLCSEIIARIGDGIDQKIN